MSHYLSKFTFLTLFATIFSFISCENDWEPPYIEIVETVYNVSSSNSEIKIPMETNRQWEILSEIPSWITVEKNKGYGSGELSLSIAQNGSYARSCEFMVAAYSATQKIIIKQAASTAGTLSVTTGDCTVYGYRGKYSLSFNYTLENPYLAARSGVEINGKKYECSDNPSLYNSFMVTMNVFSVSGLSYRAYAVKNTGGYIYGDYKVIGK